MKQLRPRTILAVGIVGSSILNLATVWLVFFMLGEVSASWALMLLIGGVGWLFVGVPTFCGMAFIRHRIGKASSRSRKIMTAAICWTFCVLVTSTSIALAVPAERLLETNTLRGIAILVATVSGLLALLTTINIVFRFAKNDWMEDLGEKAKAIPAAKA